MVFFEWNQTLSVADPIIDDDHQNLDLDCQSVLSRRLTHEIIPN